MIPFLDDLFRINSYSGRGEKQNARLIYGFTIVLMVLFVLYALLVPQGDPPETLVEIAAHDANALVALLSVLGVGLLTPYGVRVGRADLSAAGPVILWFFSGTLLGFQGRFTTSDEGAALLLLVFLSGLFLRARGLLFGTLAALATLLLAAATHDSTNNPNYFNVVAGLALQVVGVALLLFWFLRGTRLESVDAPDIEDERLRLASVTTQLAQRISRRATLNELLTSTVEDISSGYGDIYHTQIFLTDSKTDEARLAASTGEVGQLLMQRGHRIMIGSRSVIGTVTRTGEPLVARAGVANSLHRRNELLPETLVEAAFPLKIGETIIGALDLQSKVIEAFDDADVPIFQSLADSIAVAIDNAMLFEETEKRLQENQRLVEQMRSAMGEVERLNRNLTEQVWTQYLSGKQDKQLSVELDFTNEIVMQAGEMTPTLSEAMQTNQLTQTPTWGGVIVSMPLRVRGMVIGAMEFELDGGTLAPEDADLVEAVAERFGLAVESTRLYEESRRVAQRETMLNEISSRLQRSNSINAVLTEAARGLQSTLGASRVAIRLGAPPGHAAAPSTAASALKNGGEA